VIKCIIFGGYYGSFLGKFEFISFLPIRVPKKIKRPSPGQIFQPQITFLSSNIIGMRGFFMQSVEFLVEEHMDI